LRLYRVQDTQPSKFNSVPITAQSELQILH